ARLRKSSQTAIGRPASIPRTSKVNTTPREPAVTERTRSIGSSFPLFLQNHTIALGETQNLAARNPIAETPRSPGRNPPYSQISTLARESSTRRRAVYPTPLSPRNKPRLNRPFPLFQR